MIIGQIPALQVLQKKMTDKLATLFRFKKQNGHNS